MWKGKKLQKFEYLKKEKKFLDEIKSIFYMFERLLFGETIKKGDTSFNVLVEISLLTCFIHHLLIFYITPIIKRHEIKWKHWEEKV